MLIGNKTRLNPRSQNRPSKTRRGAAGFSPRLISNRTDVCWKHYHIEQAEPDSLYTNEWSCYNFLNVYLKVFNIPTKQLKLCCLCPKLELHNWSRYLVETCGQQGPGRPRWSVKHCSVAPCSSAACGGDIDSGDSSRSYDTPAPPRSCSTLISE